MSVESGLLSPWAVDADNSGSPEYSGLAVRELFSAFFQPGKSTLRAKPGILRGLEVEVSSGKAKVRPGVCLVDASQGTCMTGVETERVLNISAPHATYARKDLVVITVLDSGSSRGVSLSLVSGTPAASPTDPTIPSGSLVLASIVVPRASGGSPSVTPGESTGLAGVIGKEKTLLSGTNFTGTIECHRTGNIGLIVFNNVVLNSISGGRWELPFTASTSFAKANAMGTGLLRAWFDNNENYLLGRISDYSIRIDGIPDTYSGPINGTITYQPMYPL